MDNIDIHSHILYNIDDGSKSIEESINIIKEHIKMGFTDIVVTPHYIENTKYKSNNKEKKELLEKLKQELKKQNLNINLYLGNEVFINNNIEELINNNEIATINNSRYLLIEFPMNQQPKDLNNIIYELRIKGITPIIAHPERYDYVEKNPDVVYEWIEEGALLQSNYGSIIGIYGSAPQKTIKKLLKKNVISILATDIHYPKNKIYMNIDTIRKKIIKTIGEEKFIELTIINPKKIIENKEISKNY